MVFREYSYRLFIPIQPRSLTGLTRSFHTLYTGVDATRRYTAVNGETTRLNFRSQTPRTTPPGHLRTASSHERPVLPDSASGFRPIRSESSGSFLTLRPIPLLCL